MTPEKQFSAESFSIVDVCCKCRRERKGGRLETTTTRYEMEDESDDHKTTQIASKERSG